MVYPLYNQLEALSKNMPGGNFGLWYNKFIPISNFNTCKACDDKGSKDHVVEYYYNQYQQVQKDKINKRLTEKHRDQAGFCRTFSCGYENLVFKAKLKSPLITGIGESHPHEIGMIFEHNLGIPYIPASGIKGIVRFSHTLGLLPDIPPKKIKTDTKTGKLFFNDEEDWTQVPLLFGTQARRGSVIFLDAFPEAVPDLHVDILNPHYGDYYGDDQNRTPPGDYLAPNPIKFLTVAKGTEFVFRTLIDKALPGLAEMVSIAFKKALTEEGIGAKTAVGYGRFEILTINGLKIPIGSKPPEIQSTADERAIPEPETWEKAYLTYAPNTKTITAKWEGKTASTQDLSLVPESFVNKLINKKKAVTAGVKTEHIGGNAYRLMEILN